MSKQEIITCNKCGRDIINPNDCYAPTYALKHYSAKILLWPVGEARSTFGQRIDLCPECYDKFVRFMESESNG